MDDWDFFVTTAVIGTYLVNSSVGNEENTKILEESTKLSKQVPDAVSDFYKFINNNKSKNTRELPGVIGTWILWNINKECPEYEQLEELAPILGNYILQITKSERA